MAQVTLNGKKENLNCPLLVSEFLLSKKIDPDRVVVEINRAIIQKEEYHTRKISPGDTIELISFVGGG
ncbi:MAG: sulfur carrier protein ThiS [Chitinivibrionales bacterium]|nr:sulfur carrier protein ThiS [Chitinivibrionales bacterium]